MLISCNGSICHRHFSPHQLSLFRGGGDGQPDKGVMEPTPESSWTLLRPTVQLVAKRA